MGLWSLLACGTNPDLPALPEPVIGVLTGDIEATLAHQKGCGTVGMYGYDEAGTVLLTAIQRGIIEELHETGAAFGQGTLGLPDDTTRVDLQTGTRVGDPPCNDAPDGYAYDEGRFAAVSGTLTLLAIPIDVDDPREHDTPTHAALSLRDVTFVHETDGRAVHLDEMVWVERVGYGIP